MEHECQWYQLYLGHLEQPPKVWKNMKEVKICGRMKTIQTTALLRSIRILRRVLETRGDLLLLQCNADGKTCEKWINKAGKKERVCMDGKGDPLGIVQEIRINCNGVSTRFGLFYTEKLRNHVRCTFIFTFFVLFLKSCFFFWWGVHTRIWYRIFQSNTNNFDSVLKFKVFLSNPNNYVVLSNYFYLIIVICLHIVIWLQVTNKLFVNNYGFKFSVIS